MCWITSNTFEYNLKYVEGTCSRVYKSHFMLTFLCHFVLHTQYQRKHCNCVKQTKDCMSQTYKALFMDCGQLLCYSNLSQRAKGKEASRKRRHTTEFNVGQELHMGCQTTFDYIWNTYVS